MLDIGFKNYVKIERIVSVIPSKTTKARWIIKEALANRKVVNCTHGSKTKSIIILDSRHIILSNLKSSSILKRLSEFSNNIPQVTYSDDNIRESKNVDIKSDIEMKTAEEINNQIETETQTEVEASSAS
jgi:regulator of extracellular matrix RemA (YlzA/DUF370 family)